MIVRENHFAIQESIGVQEDRHAHFPQPLDHP